MNFESLTILPGTNKAGEPEHFAPVTLHPGELCAIAGNTGAGKSRLIKDIEQLVNGDGISRRGILINNVPVTLADRSSLSKELIAHLSQSMRFVLDLSVREFLKLHCQCRNHPEISPDHGEPDHAGAGSTGRKFKPPKRRPDPGTYDRRPCLHL